MHYMGLAVALTLGAQTAAAQRSNDLPIRTAPVRTIAEFRGVEIGAVNTSGNPNRLYYGLPGDNKLYVFDVLTKRSTLVAEGEIWNLDISPTNDRLVFGRDVEDRKVSNVWTMSLDPKTGLATAPAKRLALTPGDQPRFSPDGKWVAFAAYDSSDWSATQHLAIVPAEGGPERVVIRLTGGIGRIQWTPDGKAIYFAATRGGQPGWKLMRVAAAGGAADTLRLEVAWNPALSPDGGHILLLEGGGGRNYVVADARGIPIGRFILRAPVDVDWGVPSWSGPRELVASGVKRSSAVRVAGMDNGASREIVPAEREPEFPFWSPDGKSVAMFAKSRGNRVLLVVDATKGTRREYTTGIVQACCTHDGSHGLQWSPDGKAIVFHGEYREPLRVVDLATGAMRQVGPKRSLIEEYRWRSDSRALQYTVAANPRDEYQTIHETTLDGNDRVLIDRFPLGVGSGGMRSDTTAVVNSDSGVFLISVRTRNWKRLRRYFSPWIPSNRQGTLFVLRDVRSGTHGLEVFDATGTRTAMLNFSALPRWVPYGSAGVAFHPDGQLILVGRTNGGPYAVYAADLKGNEPRKLFDLPNKATLPYIGLSTDGKSLLYTVEGPPTSVIARIDLRFIVPSARPPGRSP